MLAEQGVIGALFKMARPAPQPFMKTPGHQLFPSINGLRPFVQAVVLAINNDLLKLITNLRHRTDPCVIGEVGLGRIFVKRCPQPLVRRLEGWDAASAAL